MERVSFDPSAFSENRMLRNPAVDVAAVVPYLELPGPNGPYEVKVLAAADFAEHDVADGERLCLDGLDGAQLTRLDSRLH